MSTADLHITDEERAAINSVARKVHALARQKGWWDNPRDFGELIALMHSKLSESLEAYRSGSRDDKLRHRPGDVVELADAVIRIMDCMIGYFDEQIGDVIAEKHAFNMTRPHRHGGKRI